MTEAATAAPCRHLGSPPPVVIDRVAGAIRALAEHPEVLAGHGISTSEFAAALPAAIESMRGQMSASNADSRQYLTALLSHLVDRGLAEKLTTPAHGEDTIYRLDVPEVGAVAIIQKGCPDGAHSSLRWEVPAWADETYLWWLCSSLTAQPGEHISKGVNRLRQKFFGDTSRPLSGIIFNNELCGSSSRPCPKRAFSATIGSSLVPAPCIYSMPARDAAATSWNWLGDRVLKFPEVLLEAFGIDRADASAFVGYVGFQRRETGTYRTAITTRFGIGRSSTYRS